MTRRPRASPERRPARPAPADRAAALAAALLAATLLGVFLLVDPRAESAFESPKRVALAFGVAGASAALLLTGHGRPRRPSAPGGLALAGALLVLLGALLSPRPEIAREATRVALLFAALVPLGASARLAPHAPLLAAAFLAGGAMNALAAVVETARGRPLFAVEVAGGRAGAGAFLGNDGWVGLASALAAGAALPIALASRGRARVLASAAFAACLAGVALGRGVTALAALAAAAVAVAGVRARRRAVVPALLVFLGALAAVAAYGPFRSRAVEAGRDALAGRWDAATSHRLGPWAAAVEMARARPLLGFGPGTFAAEYVPSRLRAETRLGARLVNPALPGDSYAEAHSDLLQAAAEAGIPAAILFAAALAVLVARGAARAARSGDAETLALTAFLVAGAVAALTWFPFQRTTFAAPLLLAAGRLHRKLEDD